MFASLLDPATFSDKASEAAGLLKSMANPHRLMILCRLGERELSVGELLAGTDLSQSALSQHLGVLRQEALVKTRRQGQSVFYSIADPAAIRVIAALVTIYCPELLTDVRGKAVSPDCFITCPHALDDSAARAETWRRARK
jgi:ArsR family transcriptional regulator, virulence genes transcriptional regulator